MECNAFRALHDTFSALLKLTFKSLFSFCYLHMYKQFKLYCIYSYTNKVTYIYTYQVSDFKLSQSLELEIFCQTFHLASLESINVKFLLNLGMSHIKRLWAKSHYLRILNYITSNLLKRT